MQTAAKFSLGFSIITHTFPFIVCSSVAGPVEASFFSIEFVDRTSSYAGGLRGNATVCIFFSVAVSLTVATVITVGMTI